MRSNYRQLPEGTSTAIRPELRISTEENRSSQDKNLSPPEDILDVVSVGSFSFDLEDPLAIPLSLSVNDVLDGSSSEIPKTMSLWNGVSMIGMF